MKTLLFICLLLTACSAFAQETWQPALPGYTYAFPRDHGQHPENKIEWWYFTGNLQTQEGRRFGYQLTFFRIGAAAKPTVDSKWALRDVWMAHFAITDAEDKRYHHADRLNRAGPGLAGADEQKVWNEDWSWQALPGSPDSFTLQASQRDFAITLQLTTGKPPVIHGANGISTKGATAGNASHYYSLPRMPTQGTLTLGKETFKVTGETWMDHEFGTSFLEPGTAGWDWFSAQLNDGSELMLFQLRRSDQQTDPHASGTLIQKDGQIIPLTSKDFRLTASNPSAKGTPYPQTWQIEIPQHGISLTTQPLIPDQEFRANATPGLTYWEGAVDYIGQSKGQPLKGHGYLEMTGYSGQAMSIWFGGK